MNPAAEIGLAPLRSTEQDAILTACSSEPDVFDKRTAMGKSRFAYLIVGAAALGCGLFVVSRWAERDQGRQAVGDSFGGLEAAKQQVIWDAEHITFEVETYVFKPIAEALVSSQLDELTHFLQDGFSGRLVATAQPTAETVEAEIRASIYRADPAALPTLDRAAFVEELQDRVAPFANIDRARVRILHIRPDDPAGGTNESVPGWTMDVLLTAFGRDAASRSLDLELHGQVHCSFRDDADIVAGAIIDQWVLSNAVFRHAQQTLFDEVTESAALDQVPIQDNWTTALEFVRQYTAQSAVEDFDGDGDFDLAVATADGQCFLLRYGSDGQFHDVSDELGIRQEGNTPQRSYLAQWLDFDNDGRPDLLLGSRLYRNVGGERFEPLPDNGGFAVLFNPMGSVVADYDSDGLVDLYVLYQRQETSSYSGTPAWIGDDQSGAKNHLWRNVGDGRFENVTSRTEIGGGERHTFAAAWLHANGDLHPDIYIANDFGANSLLINRGDGTFADQTSGAQVGDFATSMGTATGDVDDDGRPEIYVANMFSKMGRRIIGQVRAEDYPGSIYEDILGSCAGNRLYQPAGDGRPYREISEQFGVNQVGWAYAPAFVDADGDGDLDIYATTGFMSFDRGRPDG